MASASFALALFPILVNLAFGSPISTDDSGACWHAAVEYANCVNTEFQSYYLCRQVYTLDLQQWDKVCQYLGQPAGNTSPKVLCSFLGFPGDDSTPVADNDAIVSANAPVVSAAVAERDASPVALTTIDGTVYNPLSTTNFCGLPGMFCEASNVVGANGPTVVEAPNMTALAQRAPEPAPAPLTTIDGTVYNPLRTTNFCGLPGMFCNEDNVADATAPTELETPAITQRVPEPLAAPLTTIDGTVYNPLHSVGFCGLPGMFCAEDSVAEMDGPVKADAPMVTAIAERAPQPLPLTTIDGTVYNPLHSVGFCGLPGMFCGFEDNEDAQKGSHTQVQSGATPSLESPLPNPVGSIPYIPFPTLDPEKRDQEDEAPLPLRNTKTLVHDNMAPKAGANSTFKFGWQLVLGFIIGIVGSLVLL